MMLQLTLVVDQIILMCNSAFHTSVFLFWDTGCCESNRYVLGFKKSLAKGKKNTGEL